MLPRSFPLYWTPIRAASGRPSSRHSLTRQIRLPLRLDPPEEVVGGEEREVAAEVAIALDDVVHVRRHVLLVPGEDHEVVEAGEVVAGADALEVLVGEVVGLLARVDEEAQEAALVRPVVGRLAEVRVRTSEHDAAAAPVVVPGVGTPVPVRVEVVVRLPRVRRQHDRDAVAAGHGGAEDERRERDRLPAGRRQPREVEAALPRPGPEADAWAFPRGTVRSRGGPHGLPTLLQPRSAPARRTWSSSRRNDERTSRSARSPGTYEVAVNVAVSAGAARASAGAAGARREHGHGGGEDEGGEGDGGTGRGKLRRRGADVSTRETSHLGKLPGRPAARIADRSVLAGRRDQRRR